MCLCVCVSKEGRYDRTAQEITRGHEMRPRQDLVKDEGDVTSGVGGVELNKGMRPSREILGRMSANQMSPGGGRAAGHLSCGIESSLREGFSGALRTLHPVRELPVNSFLRPQPDGGGILQPSSYKLYPQSQRNVAPAPRPAPEVLHTAHLRATEHLLRQAAQSPGVHRPGRALPDHIPLRTG